MEPERLVFMMPKFDANHEEMATIGHIADRAIKLRKELGVNRPSQLDWTTLVMDIEACHCNGNPLRLEELLMADDGDFGHDVFGIQRYIDRRTGKLTDCFVLRYSKGEGS